MPDTGLGVDALGIFLSGGANNSDPDASLGGAVSTTRVRGLGSRLVTPIPALILEEAYAANGEGTGALTIDTSGDLAWTPPGGSAGTPVTIAAGETKIVAGSDSSKAVRVTREAGLAWTGADAPQLVAPMNGWFGMGNVSSAERVAGKTTYRAVILSAVGAGDVLDPSAWFPAVGGAQATYSVAFEAAPGGVIQTIADEETAPTGLSWSSPTTEGGATVGSDIPTGEYLGMWIRRVFPSSGAVSAREEAQLALKFKGAIA